MASTTNASSRDSQALVAGGTKILGRCIITPGPMEPEYLRTAQRHLQEHESARFEVFGASKVELVHLQHAFVFLGCAVIIDFAALKLIIDKPKESETKLLQA